MDQLLRPPFLKYTHTHTRTHTQKKKIHMLKKK